MSPNFIDFNINEIFVIVCLKYNCDNSREVALKDSRKIVNFPKSRTIEIFCLSLTLLLYAINIIVTISEKLH